MNDQAIDDVWGKEIKGFVTAEDVASFLLYEAFHHIHQAAAYEVASALFGERIWEIEPDPAWKTPDMPESITLMEWIKQREEFSENVLDPATSERLTEAWLSSQKDALTAGRRITKKQQMSSVRDVVGHVVNLTICLEAVLNRQLFFLRESGQITPELYKFIDRAELMPKLLFCFKEELVENKLQVSRIKQLVTLRNSSVHYRIDSHRSLNPSAEDLAGIWQEIGNVFSLIEGEPTQETIEVYSNEFIKAWISA